MHDTSDSKKKTETLRQGDVALGLFILSIGWEEKNRTAMRFFSLLNIDIYRLNAAVFFTCVSFFFCSKGSFFVSFKISNI